MKKILSLVLAIAMVLSCFSVAFAAPTDVTDKNQVKAVDALTSLGIVEGYTDGTYKPEGTITRAEMAKLLVTALGHGKLAEGSQSSFPDAKGKWYDGYVAMAAGLEIVAGYPDGSFKGDNTVTYQEAVVMTLRALGYTDSAVNNGKSAYNESKYKTLGASLGLLKNITFKNGGANRGDVAVMIYNALEVNTVKVNDKGIAEKIEVDRYTEEVKGSDPKRTKEVVVYEILLDRLADKTNVTITPANIDKADKAYLGDLVDLEPYMYQTLRVYLNDDGYVMFVKGSTNTTVTGTVSSIGTKNVLWSVTENQTKVFVKKEDKTVEKVQFNKEAGKTIPVYLNGGATTATLNDFLRYEEDANGVGNGKGNLDGAYVTFILNGDDVITHAVAELSDYSVQVAKAYKTGSTTLGSLKLPKDNLNKVDLTKVTVTGDATAIEDIAANDVITPFYAAGNTTSPIKVELVVCRDTIEGKVTGTNGGDPVINGEAYYCEAEGVVVGSEGTFYLDYAGSIIGFNGKSISNADYAVIKTIKPSVVGGTPETVLKDSSVTILNKEGTTTTYNFASSAQFVVTNASGKKETAKNVFTDKALQTLEAKFVELRDNKYVVTGFDLNDDKQITLIAVEELTLKTVNPSSKTFATAENVTIFSIYDTDNNKVADTFKVAKVEDLAKVVKSYYAITNSNGEFELIIAGEQLVDNSSYAIITAVDSELVNNQVVKKVTAYVNGEKVEYLTVAGVTLPTSTEYKAQLFSLPLSNGKINSSIAATDAVSGDRVKTTTESAIGAVNVTRGTFSVNGNPKALADNAVIYVYQQSSSTGSYGFSRVGDISDLESENAEFSFYNLDPTTDTSGEVIEVIIIKLGR